MADRPLESELMMTSYTQLGKDLSEELDHLDVFVPSGVEENELGFDMELPNLKGLVLQFKRPKDSDPRRFSVRYSTQDRPRQLDRMLNWEEQFGPEAAFYALPLVVDHDDLGDTLQEIAFIPASEIDPCASIIRIPDNYIEDGKRVSGESIDVYCSKPNNPSHNWETTIRPSAIRGWEELRTSIGACDVGFKLRWDDQSQYGAYHDDHYWYPRPSDDYDEEIEPIVESHAARFVGQRGPTFTRMGTEGTFGW